jgi:hypothetical protein
MAGLARLCIRRKTLVLFAWIAILGALGGLAGMKGSAFSDSSVAIQPGWLGVRELGSGAGGGRGEGLVPDPL